MLKLLTILFFLYTISILFSQHKILKETATKAFKQMKGIIIKKNTTKLEGEDYTHPDILFAAFVSILIWIIYIIELLYIAFAIKYDPYQYVIVGYFIFWILMLVKGKIYGVKQPKLENLNVEAAIKYLDEQIIKINKITVWQVVQSIIDLCFYIYMIYIFFIK